MSETLSNGVPIICSSLSTPPRLESTRFIARYKYTEFLSSTLNSHGPLSRPEQVGGSQIGSTIPDDHYCWQRPEDMDYTRMVQASASGPGEMAAASIVFRDNPAYSKKLSRGAQTVFAFARDAGRRRRYSSGNPFIETWYNSTGYYDEYIWAATWLFYATGNNSYFSLATNPGMAKNSRASNMNPYLG